jgi:hypothetical protein
MPIRAVGTFRPTMTSDVIDESMVAFAETFFGVVIFVAVFRPVNWCVISSSRPV